MLSIGDSQRWIKFFCNSVIEISDELNALDMETGDGEHGSNLSTGARSILENLERPKFVSLGEFFEAIGMIVINSVGGASGALYGTLFLRMADVTSNSTQADLLLLSRAVLHARDGIMELGRVKPGDKTLLDALNPAAESLLESASDKIDLNLAVSRARIAADNGREMTRLMEARIGRASYQGRRSVGHIDPGATSMAKLFEGLETSLNSTELN